MAELIEICGLWSGKDKNGNGFMSGSLPGGAVFYVFKNNKKKENQPDYRLMVGKKKKQTDEQVQDNLGF